MAGKSGKLSFRRGAGESPRVSTSMSSSGSKQISPNTPAAYGSFSHSSQENLPSYAANSASSSSKLSSPPTPLVSMSHHSPSSPSHQLSESSPIHITPKNQQQQWQDMDAADSDSIVGGASGNNNENASLAHANDNDTNHSQDDNEEDNDNVLTDPSPQKKKKDHQEFSNSCFFFLSALSAAVGSGNIWRFARIAALVGGTNPKGAGCFLMLWCMFLFTWSIPIIVAEYGMGRGTRKSVVGTYFKLGGKFFVAVSIFAVIVDTMICCYYAVLTGWCFFYLVNCIFFSLPQTEAHALANFEGFTAGWYPLLCHGVAVLFGATAMVGGVKTIELCNLVLVPGLLLIIFGCFIRTLFLPGSFDGIAYLFYPDVSLLAQPMTWIYALTQICFDTGSGWNLFLTYANNLSDKTNIVRMGALTPCGNNMVSIISGMTVFGTTFAMYGGTMQTSEILEKMRASGPAGTGLTFINFPVLFGGMPGGRFIAIFFFLALSFAALSSLICNMNLPTKQLIDFGVPRPLALIAVALFCFLVGAPSALKVDILSNQDYVWGSALILLGLFVSILVMKHGPKRFRMEYINQSAGILWKQRRLYDFILCVLVPIQGSILLVWWIVSSILDDPQKFWNPIQEVSLGTALAQWAVAFAFGLCINIIVVCFVVVRKKIRKKELESDEGQAVEAEGEDDFDSVVPSQDPKQTKEIVFV